MRPKECDIILGSDCFFEILRSGKIVGSKNEPIAQRTMFGWVVAGKLNVKNKEPNELYSNFLSTENDLKTDSLLQRWIHTVSQQVTLHGFCDASELAYSWVIYAVQPQADGNTKVTLLVAKSRVAPLKPVSIPRLELNGALLLARLYATCKNIFKEYDVHFYAWTDSQVVLSWLSSHPRNWKPYIGNRTSGILGMVPADSWRYVPTKMNPADIACRDLSPKELPRCSLWREGPRWLSCGMDSWPKQSKRDDQTSLVTKERKRTAFSFPVSVNCDFIDSLFLKFSSFTKIIDIFAFCFRYITNCKARVDKMKSNLESKGKYHVPPLTTYEKRQASNKMFSYIQNLFFKEEINCLKANKPVAKKSILSAFCPFIDKYGLIRVGGRLRNSILQYGAKHPIILQNQHEICNLIVNMYHILYLHAGCNVLLGEVITSSPEHSNDDKLSLRSRWDIVQKMKKYGKFTEDCIPDGVFPIGDDVFVFASIYYDSVSVHIRRFKKYGKTYYPTPEGITLDPRWIEYIMRKKKVPESLEELPSGLFPPERRIQITSENFTNFTFKRIKYGPDKEPTFKEISISREQWAEMIEKYGAYENAVIDNVFLCMDFLTAYKTFCEGPIENALPFSLDVSLGQRYLTQILKKLFVAS
ncbi:DUF5641 domain-containing protein [Trichonephila clavata]|uniref:DUF5641 domain-containing protein n=1 Tax=Trichonephila clavata TaxID=2740835 RepID=A0A8X6G444_TRICU|nr:DUF5641 domain-containing protein [Trichonephila clavata]